MDIKNIKSGMMEERHVKLIQEWPWDCRPALRWIFEHYEKTKQSIMKQFNLEKALAGEKVITRDGGEVKIGYYWEIPKYGLLGWVKVDGGWRIGSWTKDGKYSTHYDSIYDLFMAPTTKTVWFALCRNHKNGEVSTTPTFEKESLLRDAYADHQILNVYSAEVEE